MGKRMSIATAFSDILSSYTTDTTGTTDTIDIHLQKTSQISLEDELDRQLSYADHAFHVDIDTGTYYLRDMYTGITSTTYNDFELDNNYKSSHKGGIFGKFAMKWNNKIFTVSQTSIPKVSESPQYASSDTGITGGTRFIQPVSQGTSLSGGKIIYDNTNIQTNLDRKATLHNRRDIRIAVKGFKEHKEGDKITFSNDRNSGYLIVDRIRFDLKNKKTIIQGLGVFD